MSANDRNAQQLPIVRHATNGSNQPQRVFLDRSASEGRAQTQERHALLLVQRHFDPVLHPEGATRCHNVPPPTMGRVMGRK